jgi:hypothetical protein
MVIYINRPSKLIEDVILSLYNELDIYVYISKKSNINVNVFSSLFPIRGYCYGSKCEVSGIIEVISSMSKMLLRYYYYYFPKLTLLKDEIIDEVDRLNERINKGIFMSSIFNSYNIPFEEKKEKYINSIFGKIFNPRYGINSTDRSDGSLAILCDDMNKILSRMDDNSINKISKEYINTFNKSRFSEFIPSLFFKMRINHINDNI